MSRMVKTEENNVTSDEAPRGIEVDHVGLVVRDLDQCLEFMQKAYAAQIERSIAVPGRVKASFVRVAGALFELMERMDDDAETAAATALGGEKSRFGVPIATHMAIFVDNLDEELARLAEHGVRPAGQEGLSNGHRTIYLAPDVTGGLIWQLTNKAPVEAEVSNG
jgi:hypothetical protein